MPNTFYFVCQNKVARNAMQPSCTLGHAVL